MALEDDAVLWRYLTLPKLLSFLIEKQLYFCQAAELPDKFEGSIPQSVFQGQASRLEGVWKLARARYTCCVQCWCQKQEESNALWRLYSGETGGVAIRSTFGKLRQAMLSAGSRGFVEAVRYIDFESGAVSRIDNLNPILLKRKEFEYECEVRAWVSSASTMNSIDLPDEVHPVLSALPKQQLVGCDPVGLVDEIRISPFAPEWYGKVVQSAVKALGYDLPVRESAMRARPIHFVESDKAGQLLLAFHSERESELVN